MIIWIDGAFGTGKTAVANQLQKHISNSTVIEFDEYQKKIKLENPFCLLGRKTYPEDNKVYIDALREDIFEIIKYEPLKVMIIPIALITDYCRDNLLRFFEEITKTYHFILKPSKNVVYERIAYQEGRDADLVKTFFDDATQYFNINYPEAIGIYTDNMSIEETADFIVEEMNKIGG